MEPIQIVLMGSVVMLTIVLALGGLQIIRILGEVKRSVEKGNKILDDMGKLTDSVAKPSSPVNSIFFGAKTGLKILKIFLNRKKKEKENA